MITETESKPIYISGNKHGRNSLRYLFYTAHCHIKTSVAALL